MNHHLDEMDLSNEEQSKNLETTASPQLTDGPAMLSAADSVPPKSQWRKIGGKDHDADRMVIPQPVVKCRVSRLFPPGLGSKESKGLDNLGNSCYRNALLQCLLHVPQFYNALGLVHQDCWKKNDRCTTCALQQLANTYWSYSANETTEAELSQLVRDLRDALRTDIAKNPDLGAPEGTFPGICIKDEIHSTDQCDAFDFAKALIEVLVYQAKDDPASAAILSQVMHMFWTKSWVCNVCGTHNVPDDDESTRPQPGLDVHIMDPGRGLSLEQYLRESVFNLSNPYTCPSVKCQALKAATDETPINQMRSQITSAPEILIIRLHRLSSGMEKLEDEVEYEEYLELGAYTLDKSSLDYRLEGVVYHTGDGVSGGHFTALVRSRDDRDVFCSISDENINTESYNINDALSEYSDDVWGDFHPYVLVYRKFDADEED